MYYFLTTTTSGPTTERWFGFAANDFYYYDGGPEPGWENKLIYYFNDETKDKFMAKTSVVDNYLSKFGLVLNLIHFFILIRKELRTNVAFIIILGICLCDIMVCVGSVVEKFFYVKVWSAYYFEICGTNKQWWLVLGERISNAAQKFGRISSALFALSTALIRTATVSFPISTISDKLMKAKTGMMILLIETIICISLYILYYSQVNIEKFGQVPFKVCYIDGNSIVNSSLSKYVEGYFILVLTVVYFAATVILLVSLGLAKRRRKNLNSEKSSSTSMLITFMAISFLISQVAYSVILIADGWASESWESVILQVVEMFRYVSGILLSANSIIHCLICFFLSSQYRNVVKQLVFGLKPTKLFSGLTSTSSETRRPRRTADVSG